MQYDTGKHCVFLSPLSHCLVDQVSFQGADRPVALASARHVNGRVRVSQRAVQNVATLGLG